MDDGAVDGEGGVFLEVFIMWISRGAQSLNSHTSERANLGCQPCKQPCSTVDSDETSKALNNFSSAKHESRDQYNSKYLKPERTTLQNI